MRTPRTILAAGVALAFLAAPFGARAQGDFEKAVRKCDATIQKEALKFKGDLAKRLGKCMDQTRLEIFKDAKNVAGGSPEKTDFAKRAQKCEDQLDKALGFSNPSGSDSKLAKFLDKIDSTGDCTDQAVLEELGHLIGGDNAPPTGGQPQDWVKVKLAMSKIFGALEWLLKASPTALTTLDTLIARGTDDVTPSASTVIDCTVPSHPNLCTLHKDQPTPLNSYAPGTGSVRNACHLHECELATDDGAPASASHVNFTVATPGSTEIDLFIPVGGSTILKICKVDPIPVLGADLGADFRLLAGAPSRASKAINLLGSAFLCVEGVTAQGWCDCSGGNLIDVDVNVCSDHVTGDGDSCSGTVEDQAAESCFCTSTPAPCGGLLETPCSSTTVPCTSHTDCGANERCGAGNFGQACHLGSATSTVLSTGPGVAPVAGQGHCVNVGTSVLTALPIGANGGICNGGANDGEICDPDAPICPGECLAFVGPDEEPCTMDDLIPRGTQGTIPSTTGTASASLFGALSDEGGCTGPLSGTCVSNACSGGWNDGAPCTPGALDPCRLPCIEDANCEGTGTCTNPDPVLRTQATSFSGSPIDCTGYESSDLAGLVLVNAFPIPDTSSFGDGVTTNVLVCD